MTCVVCSQYNVRSNWLTILPIMPAGRLRACKSNTYGLLTKCEVKMAGYWPSSVFCAFMDRDEVEVHKHAKKERSQYPTILTEQAWSIKDLLYGIKR